MLKAFVLSKPQLKEKSNSEISKISSSQQMHEIPAKAMAAMPILIWIGSL